MREPEPDLVARASAGDLDAFEELVRAHQGHVFRFVLHILRDRPTAEDVTQEAFLYAFRALPRFRGESKFTTWLYRIARNAAVDAMRRGAHQRRLAERVEPPHTPERDPTLRAALSRAVDALPADLREPFVLIEVFGLSYRETSKVLHVLPGTLKSRMFRARRILMEALSAEERADEV